MKGKMELNWIKLYYELYSLLFFKIKDGFKNKS